MIRYVDRRREEFRRWSEELPFKLPRALREEVVFSVYVNHPVLEDALPLVFNTRHLIISAENNVTFASYPLFGFFFTLGIGIVKVAIDGLRVLWGL